jgi:hypothetical protein
LIAARTAVPKIFIRGSLGVGVSGVGARLDGKMSMDTGHSLSLSNSGGSVGGMKLGGSHKLQLFGK